MDSPTLSLPQASAISALSLLNSLVILISSLERTFVAKRQHDDSAFASVRSSTWQHPRAFYYLWIFRGTLGVVFCLLPLAPMWIEFVHQERTGNTEFAVIWAASTLVACIAGSIAGEVCFCPSYNWHHCPDTNFKCALKATVIPRRHRLPHPITNNLHNRLHNRHRPPRHRRAGPAHPSPHRLVRLRLRPPPLLNDSLVVHHDAQHFHFSAVPGPRPIHSGRTRGGVCECLPYLPTCTEDRV